ncbi:PaaX family transcriptional regulator C-terminal domain-containing protein [Microbacterium aquimaris]|uniref:PaaX family transcriptional regulator C-terminal domain-containing protein n=1 Tax=Microbacterium aquimaris TaxID=459816 RepID=UPI002AD5AD48|nr:PaaX family transcriptional regulator C-terminal domain-containing protein [Microbacterium aquimaris]MDZ8274827.1 PaaX family transcriptional regulator C-terminal domain-containing protein [Microbacterium aquimaris]
MRDPIAARSLVLGCLSPGHDTETTAIMALADAASVPASSVRVTIKRLVDSGDVVQRGRGRHAVLTLTEAGSAHVREDRAAVRIAFAQDAGIIGWDDTWWLYALSIPESRRSERDAARRRLLALGCAPVTPGLYVSAQPLGLHLAHIGTEHVVTARAADLNVRGVSDPRALAELLWPADPILAPYDDLAALIDEVATRIRTHDPHGADADVLRLHLAAGLERAMRHDPLLPLELRTAPWPPTTTRTMWLETWESLTRRHPHSPYLRAQG